jgi:hypothetical protein
MNARRTAKPTHPVQDWVTWLVRAVLLAMGSLIMWEVRSVQEMHENIATIKVIVDSHSKQIEEIWHRFQRK